MPLPQELAAQANPSAPLSGVAQSVTNGLDAGLAYAAAKQKSTMIDEQLTQMKEQQAMKRDEYTLDALDKAAKAKNPKYGRIIIDSLSKTRESWGLPPIDSDTANLMMTQEGRDGLSALVQLYPNFVKDPAQRAQFTDAFGRVMSLGPVEAIKAVNEIADSHVKAANSESLDNYRRDSDAHRDRADYWHEKALENSGRRLDQADETAVNRAINSQQVQAAGFQLTGANKALNIIDKGLEGAKTGKGTITWSSLHELYGDLAGLIAVKPSAGVPTSRQKALEKDIPQMSAFLGTLDREFKQNASKTVPPQLLKTLREQISNVKEVAAFSGKKALELQVKQRSGISPEKRKEIISDWENGYTFNQSEQEAAGNPPGATPPAAPPAPKGKSVRQMIAEGKSLQEVNSARQAAGMGPISQEVYDMGKGAK